MICYKCDRCNIYFKADEGLIMTDFASQMEWHLCPNCKDKFGRFMVRG